MTLYLIEQDFGRLGKQWIGYPEDTRETIVQQITEWQHDGLCRIVAIHPDMGTCRDVTAEIATEVRDRLVHEQVVPHYDLRDWLDTVIPGPSFHWPLQAAE